MQMELKTRLKTSRDELCERSSEVIEELGIFKPQRRTFANEAFQNSMGK